jgi:DNA polymerase-3 subunit delta'
MIYNNLIINEKNWEQLCKMHENNTLPHAFLFHGNEGVGKEAHAIAFAVLLNEHDGSNKRFQNFQHPNIDLIIPLPRDKTINKKASALSALSEKSVELLIKKKQEKMKYPYKKIFFEKKNTILINSIRDIKKNIHLANSDNGYKVFLIFEADKLCFPRSEAGNALLKILEEPPKKTIFILVTSQKNRILNTILSRCCEFYFENLSINDINNYLLTNDYNTERIAVINKLFNGNLGAILNFMDKLMSIDDLIAKSKQILWDLMQNKNLSMHHKYIDNVFRTNKEEFDIIMKLLIFILNDLNCVKNNYEEKLIVKNILHVKDLNYVNCIEVIENNYNKLKRNVNSAIGTFAMVIEMKNVLFNSKNDCEIDYYE